MTRSANYAMLNSRAATSARELVFRNDSLLAQANIGIVCVHAHARPLRVWRTERFEGAIIATDYDRNIYGRRL